MIHWKSLNLWSQEEKRIHECLTKALKQLIVKRKVKVTDDEKTISGQLRPILKTICKSTSQGWIPTFEASSFEKDTDSNPSGHPDIRFVGRDAKNNFYDYDIECKIVRIKRPGQNWDYCSNYIKYGVIRYQSEKYAQTKPPMGTMLGYIQEGDIGLLLNEVNKVGKQQKLNIIHVNGRITSKGVTNLSQKLKRRKDQFTLHHLWADFH